ncbi:MAG: GNAT family N-acetyltransferase [Chloroflexi bacterium]|nr:GNAT family N-acetyltransferase [Chloroflexota bacterium]
MPQNKETTSQIIARDEQVNLRGWLASDCDSFVRWLAQGEWHKFDAPWETFRPAKTAEDEKRNRKWFMQQLTQLQERANVWLSGRAVIATPDNTPLGWVSRYGEKDHSGVCFVGITICEDAFLNRGIGTTALKLWVNYLFTHSDRHKICLETWSLNPRMIQVAKKVGFMSEGCQREMQQWQGEWLDLLHFGLLRAEWQASR